MTALIKLPAAQAMNSHSVMQLLVAAVQLGNLPLVADLGTRPAARQLDGQAMAQLIAGSCAAAMS